MPANVIRDIDHINLQVIKSTGKVMYDFKLLGVSLNLNNLISQYYYYKHM